jgi:uroporphyrinogen-III synthase
MSFFEPGKTYGLFASPLNKKIIAELEQAGANIVLFPRVETEEIKLTPEFENLFKNLSKFDWIVFQNVYAVEYFLFALERLGIDFFELDDLRVLSFGETVADRLRFAQVHSDIISNRVETAEVIKALRDYEPTIEKLNFLIPIADQRKTEISTLLSEAGANVFEIPLYALLISEFSHIPKLKALLKGGAIDEFIFTSPVEALNLSILFSTENLVGLLPDTIVAAKDSQTFQSLRELGIERIIMR